MEITPRYREQFAAMLAAANLGKIDPRITPEEFPDENFEDVNNGIRIVQPSCKWFDGYSTVLSSQIDAWLMSDEMTGREPAGLVEGLFFCANHNLDYRFNDWTDVVAWGSRSKSGLLMPSFRLRSPGGRSAELLMAYRPDLPANKQDRFSIELAFLVRSKRR